MAGAPRVRRGGRGDRHDGDVPGARRGAGARGGAGARVGGAMGGGERRPVRRVAGQRRGVHRRLSRCGSRGVARRAVREAGAVGRGHPRDRDDPAPRRSEGPGAVGARPSVLVRVLVPRRRASAGRNPRARRGRGGGGRRDGDRRELHRPRARRQPAA